MQSISHKKTIVAVYASYDAAEVALRKVAESGFEGAVVAGGLGALGAVLFSVGVPEHSVIKYEQGHGTRVLLEMARASELLQETGPMQFDRHAGAQNPATRAA